MNCFGDMEATKQVSTTQALPSWMQSAAQQNIDLASDFAAKPYEAYTGDRVAPLTSNQNDAFGLIKNIAGSSNPYLSDIEGLYKSFGSAPASSIATPSLLGAGTDARTASLTDYMNPYVMAALQPMLQDIERQGISQRKSLDAQATMDGAFGDARSGVERGAQRRNENTLRTNTIGTGLKTAFDTASGLRTTDVANLMDTDKTNANLNETMLQRMITGGKALTDLDSSNVNRGLQTANALANAGGVEQNTAQKMNDAKYEEFLRSIGWDQEKIKTLTAALSSTPYEKTSVATSSEPNNSGWGMLGSLTSTLLPLVLSDRRLKHEISVIGATFDGLPIYRFKYQGDDKWHIGLMAQDLEETKPEAVHEIEGIKLVDYGKATEEAAKIGESV